jgi:hypothetical protein
MAQRRRWLRRTVLAAISAPFFVACSAMGLELPNYGYYGFAPLPDGGKLKILTVAEQAITPGSEPPKVLGEASFELDTIIMPGDKQAWLLTRTRSGVGVVQESDSVWLDRWTLKPIASWSKTAKGVIRIKYDRRLIVAERITANGRRYPSHILLDAEPYAEPGIELVMATMPLSENYEGALPLVLSGRPTELHWLRFRVAQKVFMPGDNGSLRATWVLEGNVDDVIRRYWVDSDDRAVVKWEEVGPNGETVRWVRGRSQPRLRSFEVDKLGG